MKKTKSIFTRLLLLILPLVLIADGIILAVAYGRTYQSNLKRSREQVERVSRNVAEYFETMDTTGPEKMENTGWFLDFVCELSDMAYVYCVEPGLADGSIRYLAIGFGKDAEDEARKTHFTGAVVENVEDPALFDTMNGSGTGSMREQHNQYGDMLISYTPVNGDPGRENTGSGPRRVVGAEMSITEITRAFKVRYWMIAAYMVLATVLIVLGVIAIVHRKVRVPVREISRRMSGYVANREKHTREDKLQVRGNDEFSLMAESFNTMTKDIDHYIDRIETMSREKHKADAEMKIARDIQMGLLQPERLEREGVSLRAYIQPARNVGGDLYDYGVLEDGRIFAAIADVSGKGVTAALFMSRAITLLHQYATAGYSPARILREFNNVLAAKNPGSMFITTFVGIYDPADGVLTYSNAGHNAPYVLTDRLTRLEEGHGVAAGLFEDEEYEDAKIAVPEGTLFMYTDGVSEARAPDSALYSIKRLEERLSVCAAQKKADPLKEVLEDLNGFVRDAAQSDDITMLSLRVRQSAVDGAVRSRTMRQAGSADSYC